jgi:hypothetical protein
VGNAISQGIGVATGLQSRFDFAGVAAAGVGALAGARFGGASRIGQVGGIAADALASAATRSVLTGTDFGDNIIAALPDVIARSLGAFVEDAIARSHRQSPGELALLDDAQHGANAIPAGGLALGQGLANGIRGAGLLTERQLRDAQFAFVAVDARANNAGSTGAAVTVDTGDDADGNEIVVVASRAAVAQAQRERMRLPTTSGLPRMPTEVGGATLSQTVLDIQRASYMASWNQTVGTYDPGYHSEVIRAFDYAQRRIDAYNGLANAGELELVQALGSGLWEVGKLTAIGGGIDLAIRAYDGDLGWSDALNLVPLLGKAGSLGKLGRAAGELRVAETATASAPGARMVVGGVDATEIAGRLSPTQMAALQAEHGTEFAQVYLTGPGRNGGGGAYYLIQGTDRGVQIPIGSNVRWINHTHPEILDGNLVPLRASGPDRNVLGMLQRAGSPQVRTQVVPQVGEPFYFKR